MRRRHVLVTYDISCDKRRNQVFKIMISQGNHTQYSVFLCEFDDRELAEVRARLRLNIHEKDDQVLLIDLGPAEGVLDRAIECLGRPYAPESRTTVV